MRKPRIANRNPVLLETFTRRYYHSTELAHTFGISAARVKELYFKQTGKKLKQQFRIPAEFLKSILP